MTPKEERNKRTYSMQRIIFVVLTMALLLEVIITTVVIINTHISIDRMDAEIQAIKERKDNQPIVIPVYEKNYPTMNVTIIDMPEKETVDQEEKESQEEEIEEEVFEEKPINQNDKELLAQLMYAEEGVYLQKYKDDPEKAEKVHKLAGSVVIHRMENHYMGVETIEDVIYAKGQYHTQTQKRVTNGQDVPEIVYEWAEELLTDGALGPEGLIYQSEFKQGRVYTQIGNQFFGVEEKNF